MARRSRMTIPGVPRHVTQHGNRQDGIFLEPGDEALHLDLMSEQPRRRDVACRAYCPMPDHIHFIFNPGDEESLSRAAGEAHRRYAALMGSPAG